MTTIAVLGNGRVGGARRHPLPRSPADHSLLRHDRDGPQRLDARLRGVYNVSGPQPIPLSVLIRVAGRQRLPVPEPVFAFALGRFGLPPLPTGALSHVKYPVVVDSSAFREATGWTHQFDEVQCMESFRWA